MGGGLGVDYDGSQTNFESSMNYTLEEYANDVVYHIQTVCDEAGVTHPTIVSESGRAVVAYHSVLVFNVLGVSGFGDEKVPTTANPEWEQPLTDLIETYNNVTARNALEAFHDAQQALDMAISLFNTGYLPLDQRSMAENLFWAICTKLQRIVQTMAEVPEDLAEPRRAAVGHLLLQLLAVPVDSRQLGDQAALPGDADSPAQREADAARRARRHHLRFRRQARSLRRSPRREEDAAAAHVNGEPYYLGVFLVGAYQEILGDLHNLFGDTHAVHVSLDENGGARLDALIKGDTVREVLDYVEFDPEMLLGQAADRRGDRRARRARRLRRRRQASSLLRRRPARLYLSGRVTGPGLGTHWELGVRGLTSTKRSDRRPRRCSRPGTERSRFLFDPM